MYTIFELMDEISQRRKARSLSILNRYLDEEGKDAAFGIIGMLTRQIRIIFQAKELISKNVSRKGHGPKAGCAHICGGQNPRPSTAVAGKGS